MSINNYGIFYLGYACSMPAVYFNRVLMVSSNIQHPDEQAKSVVMGQFHLLREQGGDNVQLIVRSSDYGTQLGIGSKPLPKFPNDFFDWHQSFVKEVESLWDPASIEYNCFFLSRKAVEVIINLSLSQTAIILTQETNKKIDHLSDVEKWMDELKNIVLLVQVPALVLSSKTGKDIFISLKSLIEHISEEMNGVYQELKTGKYDSFVAKMDKNLQDINIKFKECIEVLKN